MIRVLLVLFLLGGCADVSYKFPKNSDYRRNSRGGKVSF